MTAATSYRQRLTHFQTHLASTEAALISKSTDIFYFTGFPQLAHNEREAFLLVFPKTAVLFHHSFSPAPIQEKWLHSVPKTALIAMADQLKQTTIKKLLIDEQTLSVTEYFQLKKLFSGEILPLSSQWVWQLRLIKDTQELARMKTAGRIAARVFELIKKELRAGLTERVIANRITALMLEMGAAEPAFPTIVAFGAHGALPHHQPTDTRLKLETPILLDFGARCQGYCSDMTRSCWFGQRPSVVFQKIEKIVTAAYQQTLSHLQKRSPKQSLAARDVDGVARGHIARAGLGNQFIHTTGHGLGLEIHEPPSLSWQNEAKIIPGMAVTIEPGVYLEKAFGYRHENTVVITSKSAEVLTIL